MSSIIPFLFILLSLTTTTTTTSHATIQQQQQETLTAYDLLQQYGFPVGLLPKGVIGYALNKQTGEFSLYLEGPCSFDIESYTLKYKSTVRGVISQNRLSKLKGVTVKVLLLWLNIVEVTRDGDDIQFSVGIASANFGVENFLESPQCGCGFDCNNINLRLNGDVSSI